jgi:hypothetical protein
LWIGLGIATLFVGGLKDEQLKKILTLSGEDQPSFKAGMAKLCRQRRATGIQSEDLDKASQVVFGKSYNEVGDLAEQLEPGNYSDGCDFYHLWIGALKDEFKSYAA